MQRGYPYGIEQEWLIEDLYDWLDKYTTSTDYHIDQLGWKIKTNEVPIDKDMVEGFKNDILAPSVEDYGDIGGEMSSYLIDELTLLKGVPGVYFLYNKKKTLLYIGRSFNLHSRIPSSIRERLSANPFYLKYVTTKTRSDCCILEAYFIGTEKPSHNGDMTNDEIVTVTVNPLPDKSEFIAIYK